MTTQQKQTNVQTHAASADDRMKGENALAKNHPLCGWQMTKSLIHTNVLFYMTNAGTDEYFISCLW